MLLKKRDCSLVLDYCGASLSKLMINSWAILLYNKGVAEEGERQRLIITS